jgi:hypothetical protein
MRIYRDARSSECQKSWCLFISVILSGKGAHIFKKSRRYLKILGPGRVTWSEFLMVGIHKYWVPPYTVYGDSLRARRSGDRIPVRARFSALVQTGREAYPASYAVGTGSFPGVKRLVRGVDHPPPSSAEVKERVDLYLYSPSGLSWPVPYVAWATWRPGFVHSCRRKWSYGIVPLCPNPVRINFKSPLDSN